MLNPDEKVLLVVKQSRIKPGGSYLTPNIVYATHRRIIIRDPYMLGLKKILWIFLMILLQASSLRKYSEV